MNTVSSVLQVDIGWRVFSLPSYALAGYKPGDRRAAEASATENEVRQEDIAP
jgi:NADH:ubiquinone oxidoreductase subunit 2 (subunit N)